MSPKMGYVGSKTRSLGHILEKSSVGFRGHIFSSIIVKLGQDINFVLIKTWASLKMGHVGPKTRSLGQILEKSYVHSRGYIFYLIIMKLGQNLCLDKILDEFENGSCWGKN